MRSLDSTYRFSGVSQVVSYDGSVATTNGVSTSIREVRLCATTACWIAIGAAPTAVADTANNVYLPANFPEIFHITEGQKIAAIKATGGSAGVLSVAEMTR